jgi:hypothetical protein
MQPSWHLRALPWLTQLLRRLGWLQQFGINPSAYPHKIIMTYNTKCAWAGLGTQACAPNNCIAWINRPANELSLDELAHEMGESSGSGLDQIRIRPDQYQMIEAGRPGADTGLLQ